jgi:hypothetical protein
MDSLSFFYFLFPFFNSIMETKLENYMKTRDWSERTKREGKGILANTYNTCASIWATPIYLWETCVAYLGFDDRLSWCNWIFLSRFFQWFNTCIDQSFSVSPISLSIFLFFSLPSLEIHAITSSFLLSRVSTFPCHF